MLIERHDLAQRRRGSGSDRPAWSRAGCRERRDGGPDAPAQRPARPVGLHHGAGLVRRAAAHQRLGLREAVGDQQLVLVRQLGFVALGGHQELAGDRPACPGGSAGRRRAGRWCRARPRPRDRRPPGGVRPPSPRACRSIPSRAAGGRRAAAQPLFVGQDRAGRRSRIPGSARGPPEPAWRAGSRPGPRGAEVASIACPPRRKARKASRPDGEHQGQSDRPPHRIAPAHPVLEPEDTGGVDPEGRRFGQGRSTAPRTGPRRDRSTACPIQALAVAALVIVSMRGEGLGGDDHQRGRGIAARAAHRRCARRPRSTRSASARPVVVGGERDRGHLRGRGPTRRCRC
jgi:hypothetical protein